MRPRPVSAILAGFGGALLLLAAIFISNASWEALFGRAPGSLSWGPALFRVLLALHGAWLLAGSPAMRRPARPAPRNYVRGWTAIVLAILTVIAIALRIPGLNSCMWLDEVLTMVRFARPPVSQILTSFPDQNQHMLYSLLAHASLRAFGEQVWALRLPSLLFGVGSIWTLFLVGRRLIGEKEALLACALCTVSYHHIWFSQNARGYMGLLFFTNLATWLWLEAMDRDCLRTWTGYAIAVALGMWIHMTMLFVVGVHGLIFLLVWLREGRDWARLGRALCGFVLCGTLTAQLLALTLPEFFRTAVGEISMPSEWTNPLWVVRESLRSLQIGFAGIVVVLAGGLMILAGWIGILRQEARAAWGMVLPGIAGGALMLFLGHNLWPRFFFFCMGFALLIAVRGATELPRWIERLNLFRGNWAPQAGYALAGLMIVASAITVPRCYALPKQDFTGARDWVERQRRPGDAVVVAGLAEHAYAPYYAPSWTVAHTPADLNAVHPETGRTFLVYTLPIELRAFHPELWQAVDSRFTVERVFWGTLGGGEVYVCRERGGDRHAGL
jgi:mannosyltransferase